MELGPHPALSQRAIQPSPGPLLLRPPPRSPRFAPDLAGRGPGSPRALASSFVGRPGALPIAAAGAFPLPLRRSPGVLPFPPLRILCSPSLHSALDGAHPLVDVFEQADSPNAGQQTGPRGSPAARLSRPARAQGLSSEQPAKGLGPVLGPIPLVELEGRALRPEAEASKALAGAHLLLHAAEDSTLIVHGVVVMPPISRVSTARHATPRAGTPTYKPRS